MRSRHTNFNFVVSSSKNMFAASEKTLVLGADEMAKQVICAQKFREQPRARETIAAKRKGISFRLFVDDDKITVIRKRDRHGHGNNTLTRYEFPTESDADFKMLCAECKYRVKELKRR